jgi:hypothetical protein
VVGRFILRHGLRARGDLNRPGPNHGGGEVERRGLMGDEPCLFGLVDSGMFFVYKGARTF